MSIQIAIIGPVAAGKSSLLRRLQKNQFNPHNAEPTIGVQINTMQVTVSGKKHKVQIFDCPGLSDRTDILQIPFWRKCSAFFVIMDITDQKCFTSAKKCHQQLMTQCNPQNQMMIVIGNKLDLKEKRKVDYQEANRYWNNVNVQYVQTSAKFDDDKTIYNQFQRLAKAVIIEIESKKIEIRDCQNTITIKKNPPKSSGGGSSGGGSSGGGCWC